MNFYHDSGSIHAFRNRFRKRFANSFPEVAESLRQWLPCPSESQPIDTPCILAYAACAMPPKYHEDGVS